MAAASPAAAGADTVDADGDTDMLEDALDRAAANAAADSLQVLAAAAAAGDKTPSPGAQDDDEEFEDAVSEDDAADRDSVQPPTTHSRDRAQRMAAARSTQRFVQLEDDLTDVDAGRSDGEQNSDASSPQPAVKRSKLCRAAGRRAQQGRRYQ